MAHVLDPIIRTPRGGAFAPARDRRIYVLWIALVWAGMLAGFLPDLGRYFAETPPPPPIMHVHGIVYFAWLVGVTLQIALVEVRKVALHRLLGWWLAGLSVAMVVLGLVVAMVDMARSVKQQNFDTQFLGLEFQAMVVFSVLLAAAVHWRGDLAAHKRLMILMPVSILDPGTSRAWGFFSPWHPGGQFGWWLHFYGGNAAMVVALLAWDLYRHRRIHPALATGAVLIFAGEAVGAWLEFLPAWHDATMRMVAAWGWTG